MKKVLMGGGGGLLKTLGMLISHFVAPPTRNERDTTRSIVVLCVNIFQTENSGMWENWQNVC